MRVNLVNFFIVCKTIGSIVRGVHATVSFYFSGPQPHRFDLAVYRGLYTVFFRRIWYPPDRYPWELAIDPAPRESWSVGVHDIGNWRVAKVASFAWARVDSRIVGFLLPPLSLFLSRFLRPTSSFFRRGQNKHPLYWLTCIRQFSSHSYNYREKRISAVLWKQKPGKRWWVCRMRMPESKREKAKDGEKGRRGAGARTEAQVELQIN